MLSNNSDLPINQRQAIFVAIVEEQDKGITVSESRSTVAHRFAVTEDQVRIIEQEGLEATWPPLS
jgi:hypothetical protein